MTEVTTRELLFEMAAEPIGSPALQAEADDEAIRRGAKRASDALKEAGRRAAKIWLPNGKRTARDLASKEAEAAFYQRQVDLEDAVEAAGGARGSLAA